MKRYPKFFSNCIMSQEDGLAATVKSGTSIASGFATSEPSHFYVDLWQHIQKYDLTDIQIRQALFLGPYDLLVGDALKSKGLFNHISTKSSILGNLAHRANAITKKMEGLGKLIEHFRELRERRIKFVSAFIGPATNMVIPTNPITKTLYPNWAGRNKTRMGIVDIQSVHFKDAIAMARRSDGDLRYNLATVVMTPPNKKGELSHGVACGCTPYILDLALKSKDCKILLYINKRYPFTTGHGEARNTIHIDEFKAAAKQGRLVVVEDDYAIPSLPAGSFDNPSKAELAIAEHVVNHMEMNKEMTYGRAIQVGIGGTGVIAIKRLMDSGWYGGSYTEMLEPFTYALYEAGKITGSHFIEPDGRRVQLKDKMVCTFTLSEDGTGFYEKLNNNPHVVLSPSDKVVVSEGFYEGLGINNILGIDFQGHVNSAGRDKNHYSGIGGAATILRGLAKGGVGYLCMKSTHTTPDGHVRSSIFPFLPQGTPISLTGPDIYGTQGAHFYLVTEHGIAKINDKTQSELIQALVSVAHPDFKDSLKKSAWEEFRVSV